MNIDIAEIIEKQDRDDKVTAMLGVPRSTNKYSIGDRFNEWLLALMSDYDLDSATNKYNITVFEAINSMPLNVVATTKAEHTSGGIRGESKRAKLNSRHYSKVEMLSGINKQNQNCSYVYVSINSKSSKTTVDGDKYEKLEGWLNKLGAVSLDSIQIHIQVVRDNTGNKYYATLHIDLFIKSEHQREDLPDKILHTVVYGVEEINKVLKTPIIYFLKMGKEKIIKDFIQLEGDSCTLYEFGNNIEIYTNSFGGRITGDRLWR